MLWNSLSIELVYQNIPDSIEQWSLSDTIQIVDRSSQGDTELHNVEDCLLAVRPVCAGLVQYGDVGVGQLPTKMESGVGDWSQQVLDINNWSLMIYLQSSSLFSPLERGDSVVQWQRGPGTSWRGQTWGGSRPSGDWDLRSGDVGSRHDTLFIFNKETTEDENLSRKAEDDPLTGWTELTLLSAVGAIVLCCWEWVSQLSMFYIKKYQVMQYAVVLVLVLVVSVVSMCNVPSQSCSQSDYQKKPMQWRIIISS